MTGCGCQVEARADPRQHRTLWVALGLNAGMAVVGGAIGWWAHSTGVLADALDMASDAAAYAVALAAVGRSLLFKRRAAQATGGIMVLLGTGVLVEVVRRAMYGSEPMSVAMLFAAALSLLVNLAVLKMLLPFRRGEVHLRATWICTRADVMANLGVLAAAGLVAWTGSRFPDLVIGAVIGLYVLWESWEILRQAAEQDGRPAKAAIAMSSSSECDQRRCVPTSSTGQAGEPDALADG